MENEFDEIAANSSLDQEEAEQIIQSEFTGVRQAEEISRIAEAGGHALKYDIAEVLSKTPGNLGFGYMDGKVAFITRDQEVMDADQIVKTIETSRKLTEAFHGPSEAKIAAEAVSRTASGVEFGPQDVLNSWIGAAKKEGLLSQDYEPGEAADVVSSKDTAKASSIFNKTVRTAAGQIESGAGAVDVASYALAMMMEDESFSGLGDAAKAYYADRLIKAVDEIAKNTEARAVSHMAESWGIAEAQAGQKMAQETALISPDFVIPLSPEEQRARRIEALELQNKAAASQNQQMGLKEQRAGVDQEIRDLVASRHERAQTEGYDKVDREIALKRDRLKQFDADIQNLQKTQSGLISLAEESIEWATKGMPFELRSHQIEGLTSAVSELSSPAALSKLIPSQAEAFANLNPKDQYAFFLNHAVSKWYNEQVKAEPKNVEAWATIRNRMLDQFSKTGSVARIAPELDAIIHQQIESGVAASTADLQRKEKALKSNVAAQLDSMDNNLVIPKKGAAPIRLESEYDFDLAEDRIISEYLDNPEAAKPLLAKLYAKRKEFQSGIEEEFKLAAGAIAKLSGGFAEINAFMDASGIATKKKASFRQAMGIPEAGSKTIKADVDSPAPMTSEFYQSPR